MPAILAVLFLLVLSACAHSPGKFQLSHSENTVQWPMPPDEPRYRLDGYLYGETNFVQQGKGAGRVLKNVLSWIVGLALGEDRQRLFKKPQTGVFDEVRQRIYITDSERNGIFVFDLVRGELTVWEDAGEARSFRTPIGIAIDAQGLIYVADAELGNVRVLDGNGEFVRSIGDEILKRPTGLTIDIKRGELYVADTPAHQIVVLSLDGGELRRLGRGGDTAGRFNSPTHLTFVDDKLYVSDTLNARIQIFDQTGKFLTLFGKRGIYLGDTPRPKGVAVDREGRVYVVESYYDYLLVYDGQGQRLLPLGGRGQAPGQFYLPAGVWVDTLGRVFVADMYNSRVAVLSYIGGTNSDTSDIARKSAQSINK